MRGRKRRDAAGLELAGATGRAGDVERASSERGPEPRVLRCVEGHFVGTRIKWSSVGEDGAAGKPANCNAK